MKKLSTYLFLIFFSFQTSSWSNDIQDFEVEGFSIGDSLLSYFTKEQIEKNFQDWYPGEPFRYFEFIGLKSLEIFDNIGFFIKKGDKNYKILSITALILCPEDIKDCYKSRDEIDKELSVMYKNEKRTKKIEKYPDSERRGTNSKAMQIIYTFRSGDGIVLEIRDWGIDSDFGDNTAIHLDTKQMRDWLGM